MLCSVIADANAGATMHIIAVTAKTIVDRVVMFSLPDPFDQRRAA
jgi:hypothetical protein